MQKNYGHHIPMNTFLIVGKHGQTGQGHIDLSGGKPVAAAGEFSVRNGQITKLDDASGHYKPSGSNAQSAAENAFKALGLEISTQYNGRP